MSENNTNPTNSVSNVQPVEIEHSDIEIKPTHRTENGYPEKGVVITFGDKDDVTITILAPEGVDACHRFLIESSKRNLNLSAIYKSNKDDPEQLTFAEISSNIKIAPKEILSSTNTITNFKSKSGYGSFVKAISQFDLSQTTLADQSAHNLDIIFNTLELAETIYREKGIGREVQ